MRRLDWPRHPEIGGGGWQKTRLKRFGSGPFVGPLRFVNVGNLREAVKRDRELAKLAEPLSVKQEAKTAVIHTPPEAKAIFQQQREEEKKIKKRVNTKQSSPVSKSLEGKNKRKKKEEEKEEKNASRLFSP